MSRVKKFLQGVCGIGQWILSWLERCYCLEAGIVLLGLTYPVWTHWLMSLSNDRTWLSSFVEASIAFNSAVLFSTVRKWFVEKFRRSNTKYKTRVVNEAHISRTDESIADLAKNLKKLEASLMKWLRCTTSFAAYLCFSAIFAGCFFLLLGCRLGGEKSFEEWMPCLLWFFVLFYAAMEFELLIAKRRARAYCRRAIVDIKVLNAKRVSAVGSISTFREEVPSKWGEV